MSDIIKTISSAFSRLEGAYAPNTLKSYYADASAFVDWCEEQNTDAFPILSKTLHDYIEFMKLRLRYATIRRRISSLRRVNKILGYEDKTQTEEIYLATRRLKREKSVEQRQATGINQDLLIKMIRAQPNTLTGVRN